MLKEMLKENIDCMLASAGWNGKDKVALSFSAGTDSLCLFFAARELKIPLVLYTYYADIKSEDLRRARLISLMFDVLLVECPIPNSVDEVALGVKQMITDGVSGKVCLQCMHGHYQVAEKLKEKFILNGSGIDGIYGSYKEFFLGKAKSDKGEFDRLRAKHLDKPNDDAMLMQYTCYKRYAGAETLYPYRVTNVICHLMNLTWMEINKPRQKQVILNEFPEIMAIKGLFRPRGSQQIVSGTRELHEKLLSSKYNTKGRARVNELYKDLAEGL